MSSTDPHLRQATDLTRPLPPLSPSTRPATTPSSPPTNLTSSSSAIPKRNPQLLSTLPPSPPPSQKAPTPSLPPSAQLPWSREGRLAGFRSMRLSPTLLIQQPPLLPPLNPQQPPGSPQVGHKAPLSTPPLLTPPLPTAPARATPKTRRHLHRAKPKSQARSSAPSSAPWRSSLSGWSSFVVDRGGGRGVLTPLVRPGGGDSKATEEEGMRVVV